MHLTPATVNRIEAFLARFVMLIMAAGTAYLGFALLTRPLAIPLAIALWLGATAMFFLGVWGKLPTDADADGGAVRP